MPIKLKASPIIGNLSKYYAVKDQEDYDVLIADIRNTYNNNIALTGKQIPSELFPLIVGVSNLVLGSNPPYIKHRVFSPGMFQEVCEDLIDELNITIAEANKLVESLD